MGHRQMNWLRRQSFRIPSMRRRINCLNEATL
jgi:hypothetical protein